MKSTESIDETAASTGRSLADGEAVSPNQTSLMDQRRRRLVRGAVAAAPLVLTLRSGALAAASCTGAKAIGTLTPTGGAGNPKFKIGSLDPNGVPPAVNDVCATSATQCTEFAEGSNAHLKIHGGIRHGVVKQQGSGSTAYLYCDGTGYLNNEPVAILSSISATSLYGPG